jgi:hypothetical protein
MRNAKVSIVDFFGSFCVDFSFFLKKKNIKKKVKYIFASRGLKIYFLFH